MGLLVACNPAYNWREVRATTAPVVALMPCKPETAERQVPMAGPDRPLVPLTLWSCEVQGARFALAVAPLAAGADAVETVGQWQRAAWWAVRQVPAADQKTPPGWRLSTGPFAGVAAAEQAEGPAVDHQGAALQARMAWAVQQGWVVQAAVYAERMDAEVADTFLTGVQFAQ